RLSASRFEASVSRAGDVGEAHARQDEEHRADPSEARYEVAGSAPSEDLLAGTAECAPETSTTSLLEQDDENEEGANENVQNAEKRSHDRERALRVEVLLAQIFAGCSEADAKRPSPSRPAVRSAPAIGAPAIRVGSEKS